MPDDLILGVDLGGTKIAVGLVDAAGQVWDKWKTPTEAGQGAEHVLARLEAAIRHLLETTPLDLKTWTAIGVGSAGGFDVQRGVAVWATGNLPGWQGVALGPRLEQTFGRPILVDKDVNVVGLAEGQYGAARGVRTFVCLTVGTGVGGAVIIDGELRRGAHFQGGDIGHFGFRISGSGPRALCSVLCALCFSTCGRVLFRADLRRLPRAGRRPRRPHLGGPRRTGRRRRIDRGRDPGAAGPISWCSSRINSKCSGGLQSRLFPQLWGKGNLFRAPYPRPGLGKGRVR